MIKGDGVALLPAEWVVYTHAPDVIADNDFSIIFLFAGRENSLGIDPVSGKSYFTIVPDSFFGIC